MKAYLDNSATTALDPVVFDEMKPLFLEHYGNPSSIHAAGRTVRSYVEKARRKIASLLNVSPSEIFFTSGGTEADNMAIRCSIDSFDIKTVISSSIEHHAVLHTIQALEKEGKVELKFVRLNEGGELDLDHLEQLLQEHPNSLVSLMHANNEIGNVVDIDRIGSLCAVHGAVFHSDTVQTMGKFQYDMEHLAVDFIVGSAHKFHGPKGVGFLYINGERKISPLIYGGAQERNMRGGTENVASIVGMAKALELAYENTETTQAHIKAMKSLAIAELKKKVKDVSFNGKSENMEDSLYSVLSVSVPISSNDDMLLFNLDIKGVAVSGGSACSSGSKLGSHVIESIGDAANREVIRMSFSKYTTSEEVVYAVDCLAELVNV